MTQPAVIQLEHVNAHPVAAVWRALTDPALHARWWVPGDVRPIVGHRFELDMGAWGKQPCEVIAVEHERLLQYSFANGSLNTVLTWRLTAEGSGTRLSFTQESFDLDAPLSKKAFENMQHGWPGILRRLDAALSS